MKQPYRYPTTTRLLCVAHYINAEQNITYTLPANPSLTYFDQVNKKTDFAGKQADAKTMRAIRHKSSLTNST